jgi:hypothetical protein
MCKSSEEFVTFLFIPCISNNNCLLYTNICTSLVPVYSAPHTHTPHTHTHTPHTHTHRTHTHHTPHTHHRHTHTTHTHHIHTTHTHTSHTHTHLTRNYICGHIYQDFIITHYYNVFCHLTIHDFS